MGKNERKCLGDREGMLSTPSDRLSEEAGPPPFIRVGAETNVFCWDGAAWWADHPKHSASGEWQVEDLGVQQNGLPSGQPRETGLLPQTALMWVFCAWQNQLAVLALTTLEVMVSQRQSIHRLREGLPGPLASATLDTVTRAHLDHGLPSALQYFIHFGFYKFGLEVTSLLLLPFVNSLFFLSLNKRNI